MNQELVRRAESIFIKKECDKTDLKVIASVIIVASKMAKSSGIVSEEDTLAEMLDAYGVTDNKKVLAFLALPYLYVSNLIGYSVNYENSATAILGYYNDKKLYDSFYGSVLAYSQARKDAEQSVGLHR